MHFTAKSRYALKIMLQLKQKLPPGQRHVREDIAKNQNLSLAYMDRVLARLQKEKLIQAYRGKNGGFLLAKEARLISLWDIFSSVEDKLYPVKCLGPGVCGLEKNCLSKETWLSIYDNFINHLQRKNLAELPQEEAAKAKPPSSKLEKTLSSKQIICPGA